MTDLAQRGPLGLKPEKPAKKPRKPMRPVSKKRQKYRASEEGQEALRYMNDVKHLPCCITGAPPPLYRTSLHSWPLFIAKGERL